MSTPTAVTGPLPAGGTPTAVVRMPTISVVAGGQTVTNVLQAKHSLGLDIAVGEASFVVPTVADLQGASYWTPVTIELSATGGSTQQWIGFITDFNYDLYPRAITVQCHGYLILAQRQKNTQVGGTDMVSGGAGATDEDIATALLTASGLTSGTVPVLTIGGTGRLLGTVATQNYLWAERETALAYIQRLDQACADVDGFGDRIGFRTYDEAAGTIIRAGIDATPGGSLTYTFTEGVDIFSGTSQQTILTAANKILVQGFDDGTGSGPVSYTVSGSNSHIPTPPTYIVEELSSPMLEFAADADLPSGVGISCEKVARYMLAQFNRDQIRNQFVTPLDTNILLGQTVAIHTGSGSADRLGSYGSYWILHVDRQIDDHGVFSQELTVISGAA